jgi:hypothetical protein
MLLEENTLGLLAQQASSMLSQKVDVIEIHSMEKEPSEKEDLHTVVIARVQTDHLDQ